jgi:hypothetical protein
MQFDGLGVVINRACTRCGATAAVISGGLVRRGCGAHRQPWAHRVVAFLVATIARFGRPTVPIRSSSIPAVALGGDGPESAAPEEEDLKMLDMRQYRGGAYVKVDDVRDHPLQERIAAVSEGQFGRPEITFESGRKLSVNATNTERLIDAYGWRSDDWIGHLLELYLGSIKYKGEDQDAVLVRPISKPERPVEEPMKRKPNLPNDDDPPF